MKMVDLRQHVIFNYYITSMHYYAPIDVMSHYHRYGLKVGSGEIDHYNCPRWWGFVTLKETYAEMQESLERVPA